MWPTRSSALRLARTVRRLEPAVSALQLAEAWQQPPVEESLEGGAPAPRQPQGEAAAERLRRLQREEKREPSQHSGRWPLRVELALESAGLLLLPVAAEQ